MVERILVPFEGEGAGVGELSWGQQEIWLAMTHQRHSLPIGGALPLPEDRTVAGIAADLGFAVSRHQALRTRLRLRGSSFPQQVVAAEGQVPLEVAEATGDPARTAAGIDRRYHDVPFDYEHEWPIRWAVVTHRGKVTHLVSRICHIAVDGLGIMAMMDDLRARDPVTGRASGPVTAMQPLEQARYQSTGAAQRQGRASLRYWEDLLRSIPASRFARSGDERSPRYWQVRYDSPASRLAVRAIAARTEAASSVVLLAVFAMTLAKVTGRHPVAVRVVVSNRFRPGLAASVSPVNQSGFCVIDVEGVTCGEAVRRAWAASIKAAKYAYYEPPQLHDLVARVGRERGEEMDISCLFNDRRMLPPGEEPGGGPSAAQTTAAQTAAAEIRAAQRLSRIIPGYRHDEPSERFFFHINDTEASGDYTGDYELCFDTRFVSPGQAEAFLHTLEDIAVRAAAGP
jgi:condensation domain-containing protein